METGNIAGGFNADISYASSPAGGLDSSNAFLINSQGRQLLNSIVNGLITSGSNQRGFSTSIVNNIGDNPLGPPNNTVGGGAGGFEDFNYFSNTDIMRPQKAFFNALKSWVFNVPMQNLWAVVFDLPPILKPTGEDHMSQVDDLLQKFGEYNTSAGRDMNAKMAVQHLMKEEFHRTVGCLFAQSIIIPGESIGMNWLMPNDQSSGGLVGIPTLGNRNQFTSLNIGFRETNLSFIDFILRPWLILASHLGLTERNPLDRLGVKTDIHIIQFAKAGSALYKKDSASPHPQNIIPLVPRKIWRFKDCTPIRLPQGDYNYSESTIETKPIEFVYNHYEVRAPEVYLKKAIGNGKTDSNLGALGADQGLASATDHIPLHHRPTMRGKNEAGQTVPIATTFGGASDHFIPVDPSNPEYSRGLRRWNARNRKLRLPEDRSMEKTNAKEGFSEHKSRPGGPNDTLRMPENKSMEKTHAKGGESEHNSRPGGPNDALRMPEDKSMEKTNAKEGFSEHKSRPGGPNDTLRMPEDKSMEKTNAKEGKSEHKSRSGGSNDALRMPEDKSMEKTHAKEGFSEHKSRAGGSDDKLRMPEDRSMEKTHAKEGFSEHKSRPGGGDDKLRMPENKSMEKTHAKDGESEHKSRPGGPNDALRMPEDQNKEHVHSQNQLSYGQAKKMRSGGGYRWNVGNKGGLFGWLK